MERPALVAVMAFSLALSGCLGAAAPGSVAAGPDGDASNPWGQSVLAVSYEAPDDDRAYEPLVHRALVYWNERAGGAGHDVGFRLADPGETADVHVQFTERVGDCGARSGEHAAGCAPVVTDGSRIQPPVGVEVRAGLSEASTVAVLKHELGHVLGLSHGEGPGGVMAPSTELTTPPRPNATDRATPWRTDDLVVYVDTDALPADERADAERQVGAAVRYFMDGAGGTVPANTTFFRATSPDDADVVVRFGDGDCSSGAGSCGHVAGGDPDGDGALEYHDRLEVTVLDIETDAVAWHVGRWLGRGFGHDDESDYPEPLRRSAGYETRRSVWWK